MAVFLDPIEMQKLAVERTILSVDPLATPPLAPDNVSATSRTFGILVQWSKVDDVDGYNVLVSDDEDFSEPSLQIQKTGQNTLEHFYDTGNVALTRYFAVQSVKGAVYSDYSSVVSAASGNVAVGANQTNAPGSTTFDNNETTLLTATLTTTGRNVIVIAQGRVHDPDGKVYDFKLKEDGNLIHTVTGFSTHEIESTLFKLRTPSAASHTYIMTGTNTSDATTLSVDDLNMIVFEVPFSTTTEASAAPSEPPAPPQSPPEPGDFPKGPGVPYR